MISPRFTLPEHVDTAMVIAQRVAVQHTACETMGTRQAHFVWPTKHRRAAFYWYAVESAAYHDDLLGNLPVFIEADGFARTEVSAHSAALRAFDEPVARRILARLIRLTCAQQAGQPVGAARTLGLLALAAVVVVGVTRGNLFVGGLVGGAVLRSWIEDNR